MTRKRLRLTRLLTAIPVTALTLIALHADTVTVGGNPSGEDVQGPFNAYAGDNIQGPFEDGFAPGEFQQVYDSSLFSGISGPITISSLTFQDSLNIYPFPDQINPAEYTITLSSTSESADSFFQAASQGGSLLAPSNPITVFSNSQDGCPFSGVSGADPLNPCVISNPQTGFTINFSNTFTYNPLTDGNLLLDIVKTSSAPSSLGLGAGLDASDFSGCAGSVFALCAPANPALMASLYVVQTDTGTEFSADPEGLITGFGFTPASTPAVPEPNSFGAGILAVALAAVDSLRRRIASKV
ncbi:MAG TPA: hypothetical protein VKT49_03740 [Bryobacteraceae bacterium]|nr:hypothetical protein [Bryobacteraceae bacterium]